MSIAPPTDIVLDVAQAADPAKRQAAVERLARAAEQGGSPPVDFAAALASTTPAPARAHAAAWASSSVLSPLEGAGRSQVVSKPLSPYAKFEAVVLQNFVETILPKEAELFGDAASADMSRSMLAQQLAEQLARSGRIGIAQAIEHHATTTVARGGDGA